MKTTKFKYVKVGRVFRYAGQTFLRVNAKSYPRTLYRSCNCRAIWPWNARNITKTTEFRVHFCPNDEVVVWS
jgi:hypothetical protein